MAITRDESVLAKLPAVQELDTKHESMWAQVWSTLRKDKFALAGLTIVALFVLAAIFAPLVAPYDPNEADAVNRLKPPLTPGHLLGTDFQGRDILSRVIYGGRVSLFVGFAPVVIALAVGGVIGLTAGFIGGKYDMIVMRCLDVIFAFPAILLALAIVSTLGRGVNNAIFAIAIVAIPAFSRIVRASVLSVKEEDYVEAARASGARTSPIIFQQVLPLCLSPIIVYATLETGRMILFGVGLSFLGLGVPPPTAEWGSMLAEGRNVLPLAPHVATIPGLAIFLVALGLNLMGDGLRDALDPRIDVSRGV